VKKANVEYFIARRISSRAAGPRNVMVRIATVTVAISMTVMIVALAVIFGFKREITQKLTAFAGDIEIMRLDGNSSFERLPITRDMALESALRQIDGVRSVHPYAIRGGIMKTDEATQGVVLKGVDAEYDWAFFEANLTGGRIPHLSDTARSRDILISQTLADLLRIGIDDRVEMLFVDDTAPRRDLFRVTGIYSTGLAEMDRVMVMGDLRTVQRRNHWDDDQVTGYEINLHDFRQLDRVEREVSRAVRAAEDDLMAVSVTDLHPQMFDWLRAHDVNAAVIIAIMLAVALLNMISALLIILLERTRMIGELKALGMTNRALQKIFIMRSAFIVLRGMVWGNVLGIGLCLLQKYTGAVKLNEAGYFLTEVPVQLGFGWLAALNAGAFLLIVLLLVIPTSVVSRIRPDKTIRFQ